MPRCRSYSFVSIPKLKMSAEQDAVQGEVESSTYSQVVFLDVHPSYPLHTDVTCSYKLTGGLIPTPKDWIGIYKVQFLHAFLEKKKKICLFSINLAAQIEEEEEEEVNECSL